MTVDPIALTAALMRCPSVTPEEGGALVHLEEVLSGAGFTCTRVDRGGVANLFARWGAKGHARTLGFNGHTDVVPVGDAAAWRFDPFGAVEAEGRLWGRGAQDMKSGVAAFAAAACAVIAQTPPDGAIILAITGDEEGPADDGTRALLDHMDATGERMSACIVGEPTCPDAMGDMIKIGRRGSFHATLTAQGVQGHVAYPDRLRNPVPVMARLVADLSAHQLDTGTAHFGPSTLQVTTFDTGNPASNVAPARCTARLNVRFNDAQSGAALTAWLEREAARVQAGTGVEITVDTSVSGEAFMTSPGPLTDLVAAAVEAETGRKPELSTSGGTSDARFVKDHCPVVEVGLVGDAMHQVDESVPLEQIRQLTAIYERIIRGFFA